MSASASFSATLSVSFCVAYMSRLPHNTVAFIDGHDSDSVFMLNASRFGANVSFDIAIETVS